jgi:AcrR family transcriptional regulator
MRATAREHHEDKRQAILDAALELFVERHFHGTAVPAIAERAGVGDGTIYRYFENKEALVNELYIQKKKELVSNLTREFAPGASVRERLVEIGARFLQFAVQHPATVDFLERNHHESYLTDVARGAEIPLVQAVILVLEEGKTQGIIKKIPNEILFFLMYGALMGVVEALRRGLIPNIAEARPHIEECLWHAIRA